MSEKSAITHRIEQVKLLAARTGGGAWTLIQPRPGQVTDRGHQARTGQLGYRARGRALQAPRNADQAGASRVRWQERLRFWCPACQK